MVTLQRLGVAEGGMVATGGQAMERVAVRRTAVLPPLAIAVAGGPTLRRDPGGGVAVVW